jgi:hypothetical protein
MSAVHNTSSVVDWKLYQHSLDISASGVLIIWPIANFYENSYVFSTNGISSMPFFVFTDK